MSPETSDLIAWARRERDSSLRQLDLFGPAGLKALLLMPDGTTQDITPGVVEHQLGNIPMFERLIAALDSAAATR